MAEERMTKRPKERYYRGVEVAELKLMDTREFAKMVKSRARRTIARNYDVIENFLKKCDRITKKQKQIRTHKRDMIVVPKMLDRSIFVYNGKDFVRVNITEDMLGHRLGEFAPTRKIAKHTKAGVGATKGTKSAKK